MRKENKKNNEEVISRGPSWLNRQKKKEYNPSRKVKVRE